MSIFDDINLTRSYIQLSKAFAPDDEARKAQAPIHNAMERVAQYAYEWAVKDLTESGMETLEKIMKGDKLQ